MREEGNLSRPSGEYKNGSNGKAENLDPRSSRFWLTGRKAPIKLL